MGKSKRGAALALALMAAGASAAAAASFAAAAKADPIRLADGRPGTPGRLSAGEQLALDRQSGVIDFAGRRVTLADARVVVGYASEAAYLLVVSGSAKVGAAQAHSGQMILFPALSRAPAVVSYDAARFAEAWGAPARAAAPETFAALGDVVRGQRIGVFFGRYERTRFNVAASGAANREAGRRLTVGSPTALALRFDAAASPRELARQVVDSFAEALRNRNIQAVADLLDPTAFGGEAMGPDGAAARRAFAESLIAQRDWSRQLGATASAAPDGRGRWLLAGPAGVTAVTLRANPDFVFVQSIKVENGQ